MKLHDSEFVSVSKNSIHGCKEVSSRQLIPKSLSGSYSMIRTLQLYRKRLHDRRRIDLKSVTAIEADWATNAAQSGHFFDSIYSCCLSGRCTGYGHSSTCLSLPRSTAIEARITRIGTSWGRRSMTEVTLAQAGSKKLASKAQ